MSNIKQQLTDLNKEIARAERERDVDFLRGHLDGDLVFRRANGTIVNLADYLAALASPDNTYEFIHAEDIEVLEYGSDMALVSLRVWAKGQRSDKVFEGIYRNTRLFLKREDKWQCVVWFNAPAEGFPA